MPFDMGRAWNDAVAMLSANREVLAIVAGIFFFLPGLALNLALGDLGQSLPMGDPAQLEALGEMMQGIMAQYWWLFAAVIVAQLLGYIALLALLRDDARPTVGEAIATGAKGLLPSLAAYVLYVLAISLGFGLLAGLAAVTGVEALAAVAVLLGLVGMIYVSIKFSLSAPVIAIEKQFNPFAVLARSWRLTKGNSLRLFGFFLLLFVVYFVISMVLGMLLMGLTAVLGDGAGQMANAVISGLVGTAATLVFVAVLAAAHRQLAGPSGGAVSQTFE